MDEMLDVFLRFGNVSPIEEQDIKPIGRTTSRRRYEETFHDELERQDRKMFQAMRPDYGVDPRRRQELADGGMVREDDRAMANLSEKAIHHEYPKLPYYSTPYNDSLVKSRKPQDADQFFKQKPMTGQAKVVKPRRK